MSMYIKGLKVASTAAVPQESYDLINVEGVNKITFTGTPGTSHVLVLHYDGLVVDAAGTAYVQPSLNIALPNTNVTTAANVSFGFYDAMSQAIQSPGSLPYLFAPDINGVFGASALISEATSSLEVVA